VKELAERLHVDGMTGGDTAADEQTIHNTAQFSRFTFFGLDLAPPKVSTFTMRQ